MYKKSIILMPHFDDEIFNAISLLIKYSNPISIYFTHQGDCISRENYLKDIEDMNRVMEKLNKYRKENQKAPVTVEMYSDYNDVGRLSITEEWHEKLCRGIETDIKNNEIEYFIIPSPSNHQAHKSCYNIGKSLLRAPYINNIQNILIGTYYVDKITPNDLNESLCFHVPMKKEEVKFAVDLISLYTKNHAINPENIEVIFRYEGFTCSEEFAQSFYPYYIKHNLS